MEYHNFWKWVEYQDSTRVRVNHRIKSVTNRKETRGEKRRRYQSSVCHHSFVYSTREFYRWDEESWIGKRKKKKKRLFSSFLLPSLLHKYIDSTRSLRSRENKMDEAS